MPASVSLPKSNVQQGPLNSAERQELVELRRKLRQVQMARDILAKATAWFAGKSEKTSTMSTGSRKQIRPNYPCGPFIKRSRSPPAGTTTDEIIH